MITFALATTVAPFSAAGKGFGPLVSTKLFDQALYRSIE
jgi:hypothetical protein